MLTGEPFAALDPEIGALMAAASARMVAYNQHDPSDMPALLPKIADILHPDSGPTFAKPPFYFEFGRHIKTGTQVFFNFGCTLLDSAPITFGDFVAIGPNCQFITATHPLTFNERLIDNPNGPLPKIPITIARPITIGSRCWIGAGAIIMPGVNIGEGAVIGAGAIVTKDVPPNVLAVGNPARVIRQIDQG